MEEELMGEEFKQARDFYVRKIRQDDNEALANLIETQTAQKLAKKDYIEGLKDIYPEYQAELEGLCEEIKDLQKGGAEAYDWTRYFEKPGNDTQKGFDPKTLADDIEAEYSFRKLRDSEQIYVFKNGFFQEKGQQIIEEECEKRLGPEYRPKHLKKVKAFIEARNYISRADFRSPDFMINLENGVYDLMAEELKDHHPQYNFKSKIPIKYNPAASCDNIHEFLDDIVRSEQEVKTLREIAGFCLLPSIPINKAFMLIGKGDNGKTLYLDLLKKMLGEKQYVNKSLQTLEENDYATSSLVGKLACFDDDLPNTKLVRTDTLKKLTNGSDIGAEVKYGDDFDFKNFAKLVFACNELPRTNDQSDGFFRRWILVEFPYKFKNNPSEDDPKEKQKVPKREITDSIMQQQELEGFLWWAIEALKDVIENNEFTFAPGTEESRQTWREYSTPLAKFVDEFVRQGRTWEEASNLADDDSGVAAEYYDYIRKDFLTQIIGDYCEARSHSRPSKKEITRELNSHDFYMNSKGKTKREPEAKRVRVYGGLKLLYPDIDSCEGIRSYENVFDDACGLEDAHLETRQTVEFGSDESERGCKSSVLEFINSFDDDVSEVEIIEELDFSEADIDEALRSLKDEGSIFETESGRVDSI